jgi:DNA-binding beta-propeller fold protein YncE
MAYYGIWNTGGSLAIDSENRLYSPHIAICNMAIFNLSNVSQNTYWGGWWSSLRYPSSVDIDNNREKVYIADYITTGAGGYISGRIQIWNKASATQITVFPSNFLFPVDIAIDEINALLYVSDTQNNRIQIFNLSKLVSNVPVKIKDIGSAGTEQGKFQFPEGIDTDEQGNVYVIDTGNHRVQKFDKNGNFILSFGSLGFGDEQFIYPYGIYADPVYNLVYVTDPYKKEISIFTKEGGFLYRFGKWSSGNFEEMLGVVSDGKGNLYVASDYNIYKFSIVNPNIDYNGDKIPDSLG